MHIANSISETQVQLCNCVNSVQIEHYWPQLSSIWTQALLTTIEFNLKTIEVQFSIVRIANSISETQVQLCQLCQFCSNLTLLTTIEFNLNTIEVQF